MYRGSTNRLCRPVAYNVQVFNPPTVYHRGTAGFIAMGMAEGRWGPVLVKAGAIVTPEFYRDQG